MKRVRILVLVILGFFLMPTVTFACENYSEKKSCCEEASANAEKMDCCKNDNHSKNKSQDGCNGKCGHKNCVITSIQLNVVFFESQIKNNNFDFLEKKHNYFNSNTDLSSGFYSIWLIPKIG